MRETGAGEFDEFFADFGEVQTVDDFRNEIFARVLDMINAVNFGVVIFLRGRNFGFVFVGNLSAARFNFGT